MATQQLARWASELKYADIPDSVISAGVRSFYNSLGCIIGGARHNATRRAAIAFDDGGDQTCNLLGSKNERASRSEAALINGIASHVHDYDGE